MPLMTNPGSLIMGFAGVDPRQLAPSVGTTQVGNTISTVPSASPAIVDPTTQVESNLFESLGFMTHLSTLRPVFTDLRSGINLIFGAYQIYINHWGALRLTDGARAPATTPAATIGTEPIR